jgi:prophage regulatory protein
MGIRILRWQAVLDRTGDSSSSQYDRIAKGLFPPGVPIGVRSKGWPEHEVDAIIAARVAGASEDEIRKLVASLITARKRITA